MAIVSSIVDSVIAPVKISEKLLPMIFPMISLIMKSPMKSSLKIIWIMIKEFMKTIKLPWTITNLYRRIMLMPIELPIIILKKLL